MKSKLKYIIAGVVVIVIAVAVWVITRPNTDPTLSADNPPAQTISNPDVVVPNQTLSVPDSAGTGI